MGSSTMKSRQQLEYLNRTATIEGQHPIFQNHFNLKMKNWTLTWIVAVMLKLEKQFDLYFSENDKNLQRCQKHFFPTNEEDFTFLPNLNKLLIFFFFFVLPSLVTVACLSVIMSYHFDKRQ